MALYRFLFAPALLAIAVLTAPGPPQTKPPSPPPPPQARAVAAAAPSRAPVVPAALERAGRARPIRAR